MADDMKDSDDFDRCFRYYEKAIEGRNFHYKNYNAWVNLYAIFNGALFAGFCALCDKDMPMVSFIVCALGFVCAVCWHHCVRGHYNWMLSCINAGNVCGSRAFVILGVQADALHFSLAL